MNKSRMEIRGLAMNHADKLFPKMRGQACHALAGGSFESGFDRGMVITDQEWNERVKPLIDAIDVELVESICISGVRYGGNGFGASLAQKQMGDVHSMMTKLFYALASFNSEGGEG